MKFSGIRPEIFHSMSEKDIKTNFLREKIIPRNVPMET